MDLEFYKHYMSQVNVCLEGLSLAVLSLFTSTLESLLDEGGNLFIFGNGGSAANASHLANDFSVGLEKEIGRGIRAISLSSEMSCLTCVANDIGYEEAFSRQLSVLARPGDAVLALSGSGNSPNILKALGTAAEMGLRRVGIIGYPGSKALGCLDVCVHLNTTDMQIAEDLQLLVGHVTYRQIARSRRARS